ncbi:unnamed protein product [Notodromas monacha]|uniref:Egg coat matrix protein n=1 Tax=Notodromas monacha TaxID=399045 RepID=A0A7R9BX04_9CRUS|nr:unnamed protein product [Notodromas monacha]CAG0921959.1 unnamed protein product [Notodromas monacha]
MPKFVHLLIVLCLISLVFGVCSAQIDEFVELSNYAELSDFVLNQNGAVSAVVELQECKSNDTVSRRSVVSYALDQWISYKPFDAAGVLRTTKNYVAPEEEFLFVKYEASEDDSLTVLVETLDPLSLEMTFSAVFTCTIGSSAKFFARAVNHDHEEFGTYEDTKTALLNGRTLRTKTNITSCANVDWTGNNVEILHASTIIQAWDIINEGTDSEIINIRYSFWVDYFVSESVGVESISITLKPDGSVEMFPQIVDLANGNVAIPFENGYTCQLSSSFRLFAPGISGPLPGLETFGDILANLQSGQQQEFVINAEDCAWEILPDDGFELQPLKFGTKVGYWDVAYDLDSKRLINYYSSRYLDDQILEQNQYSMHESGTFTGTRNLINIWNGQITRQLSPTCNLGSGVTFSGGQRVRTELKNYGELLEAALAGRRVNFEILLGGCNGPESSAYFGGTIHDFYLEESEGHLDQNNRLSLYSVGD